MQSVAQRSNPPASASQRVGSTELYHSGMGIEPKAWHRLNKFSAAKLHPAFRHPAPTPSLVLQEGGSQLRRAITGAAPPLWPSPFPGPGAPAPRDITHTAGFAPGPAPAGAQALSPTLSGRSAVITMEPQRSGRLGLPVLTARSPLTLSSSPSPLWVSYLSCCSPALTPWPWSSPPSGSAGHGLQDTGCRPCLASASPHPRSKLALRPGPWVAAQSASTPGECGLLASLLSEPCPTGAASVWSLQGPQVLRQRQPLRMETPCPSPLRISMHCGLENPVHNGLRGTAGKAVWSPHSTWVRRIHYVVVFLSRCMVVTACSVGVTLPTPQFVVLGEPLPVALET